MADAAVQVGALRYSATSSYTRLVFDTSAPVSEHQLAMLRNPDRLIIDVTNGVLNSALPQAPANNPTVRGVRAGMRDSAHLRLVVDLKQAVKVRSYVASEGRAGHQLVVDLYTGDSVPAPQPSEPVARQSPRSPVAMPASFSRPVSPERPAPVSEGVAGSTGLKPPAKQEKDKSALRDVVVAIDAGHGGDDPGAHGSLGTEEKHVALAIARRLEAMINQQPGMRPVMIRNGDYYVGLRERIQKARKHKADLFVSIHADAYVNDDVQGSSVFTLSEKGATSEAAKWLAERENAADLVGGVKLNDKDNVLASVLLDLSQTATQEASQEVAGTVLRELSRSSNLHHRQVQRAGFAVLKSPDIPSVLVETAFISNPEEERKLNDASHQDQIARSIFQGIRNYFVQRAPPGTHLAAQ
ncbi:N-acetylmuramoyl-L-alanine amidase [Methylogaea oryzae]|uniref:N-acetylmuramoyl-L-alanine amidase AmiC n=2 Tax=Methylogaea oryzae TaxID=1295382 RepID=A0A8D4VQ25_9GAMM|nr:N-acetylmuramoyl-L-alanine amidase [Methylogaea oryzae]BBL71676.1 N-acetylmuramoyl-L-alanine amidase [Methylogaea oryzae]